MNEHELEILRKVKSGELSVEEGAQRLQDLDNHASADAAAVMDHMDASHAAPTAQDFITPPREFSSQEPPQEDTAPDLGWWKKGWLIPFWIGTGVLVMGAMLMGWAYSAQNFFWVYCAWLPMLLGLLVLLLSWWSQQARWVHVRVQEKGGTKVAVSMPIPLGLAGLGFRVFGRFIPNMDPKVLDELPGILESLAKEKGPTTVEVDGDDGDKVRVYIV